jgi:DNA-binding transcriptional regulator YiaG
MDMYEAATGAVKQYLAGSITQDALAHTCFPVVKRAARIAASRIGVDAEDASQELWLLFVDKIVPRYRTDLPLFPFLVEFARRHCLSMQSDGREIPLSELLSDDEDEQSGMREWILDEVLIDEGIDIEKLDQRRAEIEFTRLITAGHEKVVQYSEAVYHSEHKSVSSTKKDRSTEMEAHLPGVQGFATEKYPKLDDVLTAEKQQRGAPNYTRTPDQEELRNIRVRLGMTKEVFAEQLGIKQSTLDSYEYGKTISVPESVMESARLLAENSSDDLAEARKKFEGRSMSEILQEWADRLGIPVENATALGNMLNTTSTTIRRWRDDKVRPDLAKLASLDTQITLGPDAAAMFAARQAITRLRKESPETKGAVFIYKSLVDGALAALSNIGKKSAAIKAGIKELDTAVSKAHRMKLDTGEYLSMDATVFGNITRKLLDSLNK